MMVFLDPTSYRRAVPIHSLLHRLVVTNIRLEVELMGLPGIWVFFALQRLLGRYWVARMLYVRFWLPTRPVIVWPA